MVDRIDTSNPPTVLPEAVLYNERLQAVIPGGAHTYAKGPDQWPESLAPVIERGSGCHVWDVDGREYIEYGMGLRAVALGHAWPSIVDAVSRAVANGLNFVRPAKLELTAAERFLGLFPHFDMVKFTKNGSDATTAAVKLARAVTGRDTIAFCRDHPFFSVDDWFIGAKPMPAGIPQAIRELTVTFPYNDLESLEQLFVNHPNKIAAIMLEAETMLTPEPGYLQAAIDCAHRHGALFILDEMITGFRWHERGAQYRHNIVPDLATFGKAIGNGVPISALVGKREFMERGGLRHDHERVFLLSTTHGAESIGLAALLAVIDDYEQLDVCSHLVTQGQKLAAAVTEVAADRGIGEHFGVAGHPSNLIFFTRDQDRQPSQPFRTLFMQEMVSRGVLAPSFVISYSHSDEDITRTVEAVTAALTVYERALNDGVESYLRGRPVQPVMRPRA